MSPPSPPAGGVARSPPPHRLARRARPSAVGRPCRSVVSFKGRFLRSTARRLRLCIKVFGTECMCMCVCVSVANLAPSPVGGRFAADIPDGIS